MDIVTEVPSLVTGIRIELPFIDLGSGRTNIDIIKAPVLTLYERYMDYIIAANYSTDDNDEGIPKEMTANYRWVRMRVDMTNVEMLFDNKYKTWSCTIEWSGVERPISWDFNEHKECKKLYNRLREYMITR